MPRPKRTAPIYRDPEPAAEVHDAPREPEPAPVHPLAVLFEVVLAGLDHELHPWLAK